ncbi:MAG: electron transfer flavoprotein subunit alpha/FixB family protein [Candidatus Aminicenantes bacterium]|jgi:electron transfer flavoprotein alpha subunit
MSEHSGVLICGETADNNLTGVTAELIHTGRKLCDSLEGQLSLLLIGHDAQSAADEAISFGVDKLYVSGDLLYPESHPEWILSAITHVCGDTQPSIVLFGQTDMGREMAPRLGARLDASVCLDCVGLEIDRETGSLLQTKPVYGGNAVAVWASVDFYPRIVTLRPRSSQPAKPDASRQGDIIRVDMTRENSTLKGKLLETVQEDARGVKLEEAKVVVTGGGGIGGSEGFQPIEELARILHGAVGISRVPCDEGWMPKNLEIGQTGRVVSPDLYIAVGISGAPQHLAGCSDSRCIVAINKDPEAHIFKEADFGIVGDYREALPAFIKKLKSLLAQTS